VGEGFGIGIVLCLGSGDNVLCSMFYVLCSMFVDMWIRIIGICMCVWIRDWDSRMFRMDVGMDICVCVCVCICME
jgi:hypothetical protein